MYREDVWKRVHALSRRGLSKSAIARDLKMSRTTVRRLLELDESAQSARRRDEIDEALEILAGIVVAQAEEMLANDAARHGLGDAERKDRTSEQDM